nr:hypothetical protein Itr_chr06CG01240 [Ipomoea trifida]
MRSEPTIHHFPVKIQGFLHIPTPGMAMYKNIVYCFTRLLVLLQHPLVNLICFIQQTFHAETLYKIYCTSKFKITATVNQHLICDVIRNRFLIEQLEQKLFCFSTVCLFLQTID